MERGRVRILRAVLATLSLALALGSPAPTDAKPPSRAQKASRPTGKAPSKKRAKGRSKGREAPVIRRVHPGPFPTSVQAPPGLVPAGLPPACTRFEGGLAGPGTGLSTWSRLEANSEQQPPVYLGATPRELSLGLAPAEASATLPAPFHDAALAIFPVLSKSLARRHPEARGPLAFEAWPATDDDGRATWAVARWRIPDGRWTFLEPGDLPSADRDRLEPPPLLPEPLRPDVPAQRATIFADVLDQPGLYDKPAFGDCAWTDANGAFVEGWLPLELREDRGKAMAAAGEAAWTCRRLPQPSRLNGQPWTFEVRVERGRAVLPSCLRFPSLPPIPRPEKRPPAVPSFPASFDDAYRADLRVLDGEDEATFPDGRRVRFARRNAIDPGNQLETLVDWLETRYRSLGIETRRQRFPWRGIPQSNLVAVIPGSAPDASARPVLMADHLDTAFCEEVYDRTWQRVSAPGADDNASATAALLRAAEVLKGARPSRDIWLVHLTGSEFPADDLGARRFLADVLARRQDLGPLVLLDMIGWRASKDPVVQLSPGRTRESAAAAAVAADALDLRKGLRPEVRPIFGARSFLYATDGWLFEQAGFPVVLVNEHLNRLESINRDGYHDTLDRSDRIDFTYATAVARAAIETVARLAGVP